MTSVRRVATLEAQLRRHRSAAIDFDLDDDQWAAVFEAHLQSGRFAAEPDSPIAVAEYRAALLTARQSAEPAFDLPATFQAGEPLRRRQRAWRTQARFLAVWAGLDWLATIVRRVADGVPPVSETEFRALANWFEQHESPLRDDWTTNLAAICHGLQCGPRADTAGRTAERIRYLRAANS